MLAFRTQPLSAALCPPRALQRGAAPGSLRPAVAATRPLRREPVEAPQAAAETFPDGYTDLGNVAAAAAFGAHHFNKLHVDKTLLLKGFAVLALVNAAVSLIKRTGVTYDHVANVAAPAAMAVFVLNFSHISFLDTTTAFMGWRLAETSQTAFSSYEHLVFWGVLATLAAAIYKGYGTLWYVVAFAAVTLLRMVRIKNSDSSTPLLSIPALAISGWALYTGRHYVWALLLYFSQILRSGYLAAEGFVSKVEKET